jgi:uncharacterized MAPEG superfamily protein
VTIGLNLVVTLPRIIASAAGKSPASWPRGKTDSHPSPAIAKRANDAHANAVENLVVNTALIACAAASGRLDVTDRLAPVLLYARVAHALIHTVPDQSDVVVSIRALAFAVQFGIQWYWALRLLNVLK